MNILKCALCGAVGAAVIIYMECLPTKTAITMAEVIVGFIAVLIGLLLWRDDE